MRSGVTWRRDRLLANLFDSPGYIPRLPDAERLHVPSVTAELRRGAEGELGAKSNVLCRMASA